MDHSLPFSHRTRSPSYAIDQRGFNGPASWRVARGSAADQGGRWHGPWRRPRCLRKVAEAKEGAESRPRSQHPCTSCIPCSCLGDFLDQASIPCLAYMRRGQHGAQRLLWFLIFCLAFGAFVYFFSKTMNNYNDSPVIMGRDKHSRHVRELHFPAVTVCPESKINLTLFNYSDTFIRYQRNGKLSEEERDILNDLSFQCEQGFRSENPNNNTINRIEKFSLDPDETVFVVYFLDDTIPRMDFKPVLTDVGICFSFNMLPGNMLFANDTFHSSRNYLDYDYSNETLWDPDLDFNFEETSQYPFKAFGAGIKRGLHFYVSVETQNIDFLCSGAVEGFKLEVHGPADFPLPEQRAMLVPLDAAVRVAVRPHHVRAQASLRRSFAPDDRLCFFPGERSLRFFKHYTLANCELECLANVTLRACGCVDFYMPRSPETPICGGKKTTCSERVATLLHATQLGIETEVKDHCNCLQSCSYVKYKSKMSLSSLLTERYLEIVNDRKSQMSIRATLISIYFEEAIYTPIRRYEMYSLPDFIANCGGLLGLCLGMSILSVAELLYWLVVRLFWATFKHRWLVNPSLSEDNNMPEKGSKMFNVGVTNIGEKLF